MNTYYSPAGVWRLLLLRCWSWHQESGFCLDWRCRGWPSRCGSPSLTCQGRIPKGKNSDQVWPRGGGPPQPCSGRVPIHFGQLKRTIYFCKYMTLGSCPWYFWAISSFTFRGQNQIEICHMTLTEIKSSTNTSLPTRVHPGVTCRTSWPSHQNFLIRHDSKDMLIVRFRIFPWLIYTKSAD